MQQVAPMSPTPGSNYRSGGGSKSRTNWHKHVNGEIVQAANSGNYSVLIDTIEKYLNDMNLVNTTTAIHRLAKLAAEDNSFTSIVRHPVVQRLVSSVQAHLEAISAARCAPSSQALSNIMWSMATLQLSAWSVLEEVAILSVSHMGFFKPLEVSTLLWSFARYWPDANRASDAPWFHKVFDSAAVYIQGNVDKFSFRSLVTAIGAFATTGKTMPRMFQVVAKQMMAVAHTANSLELAKTAWAFGTANVRNEKLFSALAKHSVRQLQSFRQQELSILLWGFATNEVFHQDLFTKASGSAQNMDLSAQQLANIVWALTRVRPQWPVTISTVRALMPQCSRRLQTFKPQEFASTALSAARAFGHVGEDLGQLDSPVPSEVMCFFDTALPMMLPRLFEFSDQSLANVATAYTAVRATSVMTVLTCIGQEMVYKRLHSLEPPLLLQLIRTFSTPFDDGFGATLEEQTSCIGVAQALFRQSAKNLDKFAPQHQESLSQLCSRVQGTKWDHVHNSKDEVLELCLRLSAQWPYRRPTSPSATMGVGHTEFTHPSASMGSLMQANTMDSSGRRFSEPNTMDTSGRRFSEPNVMDTSGKRFGEPNAQETTNESPAESQGTESHLNEGTEQASYPNADSEQNESWHQSRPNEDPELRGSHHNEASFNNAFRVNKTFIEPACAEIHPLVDPYHNIMTSPVLPFVDAEKRAFDPDTMQAIREEYFRLKAIRGVDFVSSYDKVSAGSSVRRDRRQYNGHVLDVTGHSSGSGSVSTPSRDHDIHSLRSEVLQAFRKDYQELRAVPGLDWSISHSPWLQKEHHDLYGTSLIMKHRNRIRQLGLEEQLPEPLPFVKNDSLLQTVREVYQSTIKHAVPGVDYTAFPSTVPGTVAEPLTITPSRWLLDYDQRTDVKHPLLETKALERSPLDFLVEG